MTSSFTIQKIWLHRQQASQSSQYCFLFPFDSCNHQALISLKEFQDLTSKYSSNFSWRIFCALIRCILYFLPTQKLHHQGSSKINQAKHPIQIQYHLSLSFCTGLLNLFLKVNCHQHNVLKKTLFPSINLQVQKYH